MYNYFIEFCIYYLQIKYKKPYLNESRIHIEESITGNKKKNHLVNCCPRDDDSTLMSC